MSEDEISEDWNISTVGEVIETAINGGTPKRSSEEYWGGEIPWLSSSEVRGKYTNTETNERITKKGLNESSAKIWPKDTVLVAMYGRGTIGRPAITSGEQAGNQAICGLVPDTETITCDFLYYWIESIREKLAGQGRGATASQQNLNQSIIKSQKIPVPPLEKQDRIVQYIEDELSTLANIQNSVGSIDKLSDEFRNSSSVFLNLGTNSKNESFQWSSVEDHTPSHWDMVELSEAVEYKSNLIDPSQHPDRQFTLLELENIESHSGQVIRTEQKIGSEIGSSKREFAENHILYCKLRPYLNKVVSPTFSGIASSELLVLKPNDGFVKEYIHHYLLSPPVFELAESLMTGANQPRIKKSDLMEFQIPKPPIEEQKELVQQYDKIEQSYLELTESVDALKGYIKEYRNSILHHAFQKSREKSPSITQIPNADHEV